MEPYMKQSLWADLILKSINEHKREKFSSLYKDTEDELIGGLIANARSDVIGCSKVVLCANAKKFSANPSR